jgi:glycerophosphoryl diester phosphodiesterase
MNTIKINSKNVKMIAHRGLSGLEKENTCSAFVAAGNREKYFGIETDVHCTADGKYIVIHDDNTGRVGLDKMVVEESTFDTLRKLQLLDIDNKRGRGDLMLPTVEEYIGICSKYEKHAVLELKNPMPAEDVYNIVSKIEEMGYLSNVIFISFALENLVALREKYPTQPAQYLIEKEWKDSYLEDLKKYNLGLDIDHRILTKEIVESVHALGQEVNCWTVNTLEAGEAVIEMGVDYITTNILE